MHLQRCHLNFNIPCLIFCFILFFRIIIRLTCNVAQKVSQAMTYYSFETNNSVRISAWYQTCIWLKLFFVYDNSTGIVPAGTIPFYRELFVVVDLGTDCTKSFNPTWKY